VEKLFQKVAASEVQSSLPLSLDPLLRIESWTYHFETCRVAAIKLHHKNIHMRRFFCLYTSLRDCQRSERMEHPRWVTSMKRHAAEWRRGTYSSWLLRQDQKKLKRSGAAKKDLLNIDS